MSRAIRSSGTVTQCIGAGAAVTLDLVVTDGHVGMPGSRAWLQEIRHLKNQTQENRFQYRVEKCLTMHDPGELS